MATTEERIIPIEWGTQQDNGGVLLSPAWEVFILGVSILSLLNLLLVVLFRSASLIQVFIIMESVLTIVFLSDLARRLIVARDRKAYMARGYGWVDALAAFPPLRILRIIRVVRSVRVLRRFTSPVTAFKVFFSNRAAGGLLSVLLVALLVLEFGSLAILYVEQDAPGSNIDNAGDAVWYLLVTMSTVGYGDYYPVTDAGRIIGSIIIVVGVGVFGTLTGFLANTFLAPSGAVAPVAPPATGQADSETAQRSGEGTDGAAAGS